MTATRRAPRITLRGSLRLVAVVAATAVALTLAACAATPAATPTPTATAVVTPKYLTPGKLTIGTGEPAYGPWIIDDKPENGKGFESSVAYAIAAKLGFAASDVVWVRTGFDEAIAPGPKNFDFNLQQFTITDQRKQAVDFSSPYYETGQAVVTLKGSKAASAKTLADLKGLLIGAAATSTSFAAIEKVIAPTQGAQGFDSNDAAKAALENGQIDAIVLDVPTATYFVDNGIVLGRLQPAAGEQYGLVLDKGSSLTTTVSAAIDALRKDGTLDSLAKQWLTDYNSIPILQ